MSRSALICMLGLVFSFSAAPLQAGGLTFGVLGGMYSPNKGLDDNDNGLAFGGNIQFKFTAVAVKLEGLIIDSSGRYNDILGEDRFGGTDIEVDNILSADLMFYPLGTTFFVQVGLNRTNMDKDNIELEIVDNETGFEVGAGAMFFDKLSLQGKIIYTPDALESSAVDTLDNLDDTDLMSFLVTVGWHF